MLSVIPVKTKEEQQLLCSACGVEYKPECFAYGAYEGENPLACTQFSVTEEYILLENIALAKGFADLQILIFTGRSVFNFADRRGIKFVYAKPDAAAERELLAIGYKIDPMGDFFINLEGYFECCPGEKTKRGKH